MVAYRCFALSGGKSNTCRFHLAASLIHLVNAIETLEHVRICGSASAFLADPGGTCVLGSQNDNKPSARRSTQSLLHLPQVAENDTPHPKDVAGEKMLVK